jgi:16S rRNA (cytosine967-C5)-methyltransferase
MPSPRFKAERRPDEISPARLGAARALYSLEKGSKVSDVLVSNRNLKPEDESLLRELVYGCTRQKRLLDHYLNSLCQSPFEKLPVEVKISLRLGLYQLLFLDRVPAHAAVHESVNLAKKGGQEKLSGFVNAVLRNAETKKSSLEAKGDSEVDTLSLRYSHPTWLTKKWAKEYGEGKVEEILKADNRPHPVYLHVKPGLGDKVVEDLGRQGVRVTKDEWPHGTLRLRSHEGGLFTGESFQQGDWIVQDWVPQAMLELLPLSEGQRAWDVCAAPGGKTVALAWKLGEKGQVMASDASEDRRKKLTENLKRTGLKQVQVYDGDVRKLAPSQKFDLAWVDAPCSGTGVLSRRADLRWRLIPKDVSSNLETQRGLLEEAQGHIYPKGFLVYSTCSLEKEENGTIVESFLKDHPEWKAMLPELPGEHPEVLKDDLGLTFLPTDEHDGGFLAVLTRG